MNIWKDTNRCLQRNVFFLKRRDHVKSREWEVQEVSLEGLTFCNLDEMETLGQKVQIIGANREESKQNCAEMSKILSQNLYFPQKNNMGVFGNITVFSSHVLILQICLEQPKLCLTFTQHVWKKTNTLVYLHLGAFFHTCLDFDT